MPARAQISANWLNPVSGNWNDPSNWSTNPVFPNNSGPNTYNCFIAATGAGYTVSLNQDITINDLSLTSSDAILDLTSHALHVNGNYSQSAGVLRGPVAFGTMTVGGTASFTG